MDLNEVAVFIQVVQSGSFSKAAQHMGVPNSTVSFKVSSLEKRLGVTLIHRTTRKLNITPLGQVFYKRCLQGLEEIRAAEQELASSQSEPQGLLRLTAPLELSSSVLPSLLSAYLKQYPKTRVEVLLSDRVIDLLSENVDLAIRAGELKDSSMITKKIGIIHFLLVAAPSYIQAHGQPKHPRDLWKHQCLQFTPLGYQEWRLIGPKGTLNAPIPGQLIINDLAAVKTMTLSGAGIALMPTHYCYQELQSGKLMRILPEWKTKGTPIQFVYPAQRFVAPKLSAFMQIAQTRLKKLFEGFDQLE